MHALAVTELERPINLRWLYVAAPVALAASYTTLLLGPATADWLTDEDGFFEYLGALGLLTAAVMFLLAFVRSSRAEPRRAWALLPRIFLLTLAILFMFAAGEEISWGQRVLGFETPETIRAANIQEETNVHNIVVFDQFGQGPFFFFTLFWFIFTLAVPVVAFFRPARRVLKKLVPIVPLGLGALALANYAMSKTAEALGPAVIGLSRRLLDAGRVEIQEANLAVLAALTGFYIYRVMLSPTEQRRRTTVDAPTVTPHPSGHADA